MAALDDIIGYCSPDELHAWRMGTETAGWVHLNSAGSAPAHKSVHDEMVQHLELERTLGGYAAVAHRKKEGGRDAHDALAELLQCDADEIALVESAQVGWAKAFYSLDFREGDRIICWTSEYAGNAVAFLQQAKRLGATVDVLPMRPDGLVDVRALERALASGSSGRTLVALTHVQTGESTIQPAREVGQLAKASGAVYLLDACQTIGQLDVHVRELQCDFCCGTGRKWLRGPRGTGFLYTRREALPVAGGSRGLVGEPPMVDHVGASMVSETDYRLADGARRYEMFESSEAARAGLAAAVDVCLQVGPARIGALAASYAAFLRRGLTQIEGIALRDAPGAADDATAPPRCGIVTFDASAVGLSSQQLAAALAARKIGVSVSPSIHSFDTAHWRRPAVVRVSPSYFNTSEEMLRLLDAVKEIVSAVRE